MLSYQHGYHAGNRADVHKHAALCILLARLVEKPKPLTYMETHAGRGLYNLNGPEALKTGEAQEGIRRLRASGGPPPGHPYRQVLESTEKAFGLGFYPGSPLIAKTLLRPEDQIHLMELHPQEHAALRRAVRGDNVHVHKRDGFEGVLALSPPTPRRGLVLIDPSYEVKTEYRATADFVQVLHRKWPEATILVWYPVLEQAFGFELTAPLLKAGLPDLLHLEIAFPPLKDSHGMVGSGLILINTPYGVEEALHAVGKLI